MKKLLMRVFGGEYVHGQQTLSAWKLGAAFLVGVAIIGWASFSKAKITTWLTPGENIKVHFASDYRLTPYYSKAKIAFVPIGMVTDVEEQPDRTSLVTVKMYGDSIDKLGSEPSAVLRPTTLLGGNYFVDLVPAGNPGTFRGPEIPVQRTQLPSEVDKLIHVFQPAALVGANGVVTRFSDTLEGGTNDALHRVFRDAPSSLKPTAVVLNALRGQHPDTDLTDLVVSLEDWTRQGTAVPGQLDSSLTNLGKVSVALGSQSQAFATTLDELPGALRSAKAGLARLNTTLDVLEDSADEVRPEARKLNKLLEHINPVLHRARPVVHELREVVDDARPLLRQLVPDVRDLDDVVEDFKGAPLNRVNGPVAKLLLNPFKGRGPYAQSQSNKKIYQELGFAVSDLDRATVMDRNGSDISFEPFAAVEPDNTLQNDGQPRMETLERSVADPNRINPPLQSPGQAMDPQRKAPIPFAGGSPSAHKEGR